MAQIATVIVMAAKTKSFHSSQQNQLNVSPAGLLLLMIFHNLHFSIANRLSLGICLCHIVCLAVIPA